MLFPVFCSLQYVIFIRLYISGSKQRNNKKKNGAPNQKTAVLNGVSGIFGSGDKLTKSLSETTSTTENGITKSNHFSVTINVAGMNVPEKHVIIQMTSDNAVISRDEFNPGEIDDIFKPEVNTAYIVLETHSRDSYGELIISREIFDRGTSGIEIFIAREDGICVGQYINLEW